MLSEEEKFQTLLTAFADGETSAEENVKVLQCLERNPRAVSLMTAEQRLRIAARRAMVAPEPPAALRASIEALAAGDYSPQLTPAKGWNIRKIVWPLATAAAVLLGISVGRFGLHETTPGSTPIDSPLPASLAADATRVHVDCSRMLSMHTAPIPKELGALSIDIKSDFRSQNDYPDLLAAGYAFVGAGQCAKPLQNTAHLLYHSTKPGVTDTISVFARPADAATTMEVGRAYLLSAPDAPHAIYAWRTQRVIYVIVGDDIGEVTQVRDLIAKPS